MIDDKTHPENDEDATKDEEIGVDRLEVAQRLKKYRIEAGFRSGRAFALAAGVSPITYHHHENGRRGIPRAAAQKYAEKLMVPTGTLLFAEALQVAQSAKVIGAVTAKGTVIMGGETSEIPLPAGIQSGGVVAIKVETDDLWPAYRPNDFVFYRQTEEGASAADCNGKDCVVVLTDGTTVLRMFTIAGPKRANLMAFSGPPMLNIEYAIAYPVVSILRG